MVLAWRAIFLWSCISGSIHPSSRCIHHSPSSSSAPKSCASRPCIVLLAYLNEMHQCRCLNAWKCSRRYSKKNKQGRHNVTIAWARIWCNAMRLKERHDWAIIYRVSTANKLKRQNELVLQNKSSLNVFSLKYFLYKILLNLFRKDQADAISKLSN